jgi:hypothetical protein
MNPPAFLRRLEILAALPIPEISAQLCVGSA